MEEGGVKNLEKLPMSFMDGPLWELQDNIGSVGFKKIYPRDLVHFIFFLGIKLFCCQNIKMKLWASFWFIFFWNLPKFQVIQTTFRGLFFLWKIKVVRMSWIFVRCHEIFHQTDVKDFSFLSWQTKKFLS